jgi:Flp pilus assembly protein CpaB
LKATSKLRLGLVAAIAACLFASVSPHPLAALSGLWSSDPADSVPVLVADAYLPAFQVVKPQGVKIRNYPKDFVPPGALHAKSELVSETGQFIFSSIVAIPEGEPLTRTILVEVGKDHGLSSLLHLGQVAVSFSIDKARAAGGWIQPGDTVALFETLPPDLSGGLTMRKKTRLLLNRVKVLAVDKAHLGQRPEVADKTDAIAELTAVESESHVITVLVNPTDADALIDARERGPLSVVLRAIGDDLPWLPIK